jgi:hypothetical protein
MPQAWKRRDAHDADVCMQRPRPAPGAQMKFRKGSRAWHIKRGLYYTAAFIAALGGLALLAFVWEAIAPKNPQLARMLAGAAFLQFMTLFFSFFAEEER